MMWALGQGMDVHEIDDFFNTNVAGEPVEGTEILSNVVKLSNVHLLYSLPPVKTPGKLNIVGHFCDWDWSKCLKMVPVWLR